MKAKKLLSVVLAYVMVLGLLPMSALAANYGDASGHWAEAAINRWSDYGIVTGDERGFRPNDNMTRAEAAKVLCELFGLTSTAGAASFTDVPANAWYADYIAKANAAGIMGGVGNNQAAPNAPLTRETFFVMFARGLGLKEQSTTSGVAADGDSWANGYINALTDKGYVKGDGTGVNALANINRASVMSLLDQTIAQYVNANGTVALTADKGIVLVNAKNVTLTGTTNADVVIAKGASNGSVSFSKATVNGAVTVQADNATVTADKDSKLASAPVVNGAGTTYTAADGTTTTTPGGTTTTVTWVDDGRRIVADNAVNKVITAASGNANPPSITEGETYRNIVIGTGAGDGTVTLKNITIANDLIIEGGGKNSIKLDNVVIGGKIFIQKASGEAPRLELTNTPLTRVGNEVVVAGAAGAIIEATDTASAIKQVTTAQNVEIKGDKTTVATVDVAASVTPKTAPSDGTKTDAADTTAVPSTTVTLTVEDAEVTSVTAEAVTSTTIKVDNATIDEIAAENTTTIQPVNEASAPSTIQNVTASTTGSETVTVKADVQKVTVPATNTAATAVSIEGASVSTVEVATSGSNTAKVELNGATVETLTSSGTGKTEIDNSGTAASSVGTVATTTDVEVKASGSGTATVAAVEVNKASTGDTAAKTVTVTKGTVNEITAKTETTVTGTTSDGVVGTVNAQADVEVKGEVVSDVKVEEAAAVKVASGSVDVEIATEEAVEVTTASGASVTSVSASESVETVNLTKKSTDGSGNVTTDETQPTVKTKSAALAASAVVLSSDSKLNDTLTVTLPTGAAAGDKITLYTGATGSTKQSTVTTPSDSAFSSGVYTVQATDVTAGKVEFTYTSGLPALYVAYQNVDVTGENAKTYTESDRVAATGYVAPLAFKGSTATTINVTLGETIKDVDLTNLITGDGEYTITAADGESGATPLAATGLTISKNKLTGTVTATEAATKTVNLKVTRTDGKQTALTGSNNGGTLSIVMTKVASKTPTAVLSGTGTGGNKTLTLTFDRAPVADEKVSIYADNNGAKGSEIKANLALTDGMINATAKTATITLTTAFLNGSGEDSVKITGNVWVTYTSKYGTESAAGVSTGFTKFAASTTEFTIAGQTQVAATDGVAAHYTEITTLDLAAVLSGGTTPYTFGEQNDIGTYTGLTYTAGEVGSVDNAGKISGTPTKVAPEKTYSITVTDAASQTVTLKVTIGEIKAANSPASLTVGVNANGALTVNGSASAGAANRYYYVVAEDPAAKIAKWTTSTTADDVKGSSESGLNATAVALETAALISATNNGKYIAVVDYSDSKVVAAGSTLVKLVGLYDAKLLPADLDDRATKDVNENDDVLWGKTTGKDYTYGFTQGSAVVNGNVAKVTLSFNAGEMVAHMNGGDPNTAGYWLGVFVPKLDSASAVTATVNTAWDKAEFDPTAQGVVYGSAPTSTVDKDGVTYYPFYFGVKPERIANGDTAHVAMKYTQGTDSFYVVYTLNLSKVTQQPAIMVTYKEAASASTQKDSSVTKFVTNNEITLEQGSLTTEIQVINPSAELKSLYESNTSDFKIAAVLENGKVATGAFTSGIEATNFGYKLTLAEHAGEAYTTGATKIYAYVAETALATGAEWSSVRPADAVEVFTVNVTAFPAAGG